MREIKYRGWHKDLGMMEVDFIDFKLRHIGTLRENNLSLCFDFEDVILMQFTGFTDYLGREIYEGDIIRDQIYDETTEERLWSIVTWAAEYGWWCLDNGDVLWGELNNPIIGGNIYQNPELMEK